MRRALVPALLLAVALTSGAEIPSEGLPADETPTECDMLKQLFCTKANQIAENNLLRTWQIIDDYDDYNYNDHVDKPHGMRYDDSSADTRTWMYPSQFGRLQRGFAEYRFTRQEQSNRYVREAPNFRLVYLRTQDVVIENDKTYYVYDSYVGSSNPFNFLSVRYLCPGPMSAPPSYDESNADQELENEEPNEITLPVTDDVEKRGDIDVGQKEVPDNLIFGDDEKGEAQKKLFALWSRMQSLTPKGRKLPSRRHTFAFYGRDGALSAETRAAAARLRPPGQPLRWG